MSTDRAKPATDYRFVWRPGWILSHVFVLSCVVLFIFLGFWQLRRLDERKTYNATVAARESDAVQPLQALLPAGPAADKAQIEDVQYRPVTVTGTYAPDQEVLVRNRTSNGMPGFWMITPLVLEDGTAVAVNRGWIPFATTNPDGPWPDYAPTPGVVTVTGMIREGQVRTSGFVGGPTDAAEGRLTTLSRVDLARLQQQVTETLYPVSIDLRTQQPAPGQLPVPVPEPELSEGSHLSYAGQWFLFALLTIIVYPLLLRRTARNKAADDDDEGPDGGSGDDPADLVSHTT